MNAALKMAQRARTALQGNKTYIVAAIGLLTALLAYVEGSMTTGEFIIAALGATTGTTIKAGQNRIEAKADPATKFYR